MDRLTYFACNCWQVKGADDYRCSMVCDMYGDSGCIRCPIAKAFDRLAAYENTGLEPADIPTGIEMAQIAIILQMLNSSGLTPAGLTRAAELVKVLSPCEIDPEKSISSYPTCRVDFRNASDDIEEIIKKLKAASHESLNSDAMNQMGSVVLRLIEERLG